MNTNPEMTDSTVLARVLDDMQFLGLIELIPDEDEKPRWSAIKRKSEAEDQKDMSNKAA